jgi:hypothetical protein
MKEEEEERHLSVVAPDPSDGSDTNSYTCSSCMRPRLSSR